MTPMEIVNEAIEEILPEYENIHFTTQVKPINARQSDYFKELDMTDEEYYEAMEEM